MMHASLCFCLFLYTYDTSGLGEKEPPYAYLLVPVGWTSSNKPMRIDLDVGACLNRLPITDLRAGFDC